MTAEWDEDLICDEAGDPINLDDRSVAYWSCDSCGDTATPEELNAG